MSQTNRTLLGFDYGRRRIGVAVGQEFTAAARPLRILPSTRQQQPDWQAIDSLIDDWRPQLLVVGIPYLADGSSGERAQAARAFAAELEQRYALTVATVDERLSSHAAAERLAERAALTGKRRRSTALDDVAAALILETWFTRPEGALL